MGVIISSIHQKDLLVPKLPPVQRRNRIPVEDLSHGYNIPIFQYRKTGTSGIKIKLKKVVELYIQYEILKEISSLNTLWHIGWLLNPSQGIHSNWAGYMQTIESRRTLPSASDVIPLPIIDMDPGNLTCIYSTLLYVIQKASKLDIPTPCITFDQPLWVKAVEKQWKLSNPRTWLLLLDLELFTC